MIGTPLDRSRAFRFIALMSSERSATHRCRLSDQDNDHERKDRCTIDYKASRLTVRCCHLADFICSARGNIMGGAGLYGLVFSGFGPNIQHLIADRVARQRVRLVRLQQPDGAASAVTSPIFGGTEAQHLDVLRRQVGKPDHH